jgi:hypothetical protein
MFPSPDWSKNQKAKGKNQKAKVKSACNAKERGRCLLLIFAFCLLPFDFKNPRQSV